MNFLFDLKYKKEEKTDLDYHLKNWLIEHGSDSLGKYEELEKNGFKKPLKFMRESVFRLIFFPV